MKIETKETLDFSSKASRNYFVIVLTITIIAIYVLEHV